MVLLTQLELKSARSTVDELCGYELDGDLNKLTEVNQELAKMTASLVWPSPGQGARSKAISVQRLNVAVTRAQALLLVVGNPHVLAKDANWFELLKHIVDLGGYTGCDLPLILQK